MKKERTDAAATVVYSVVIATVGFGLLFFSSVVTDATVPVYSAETDVVVTVMTTVDVTTAGFGSLSCSSSVADVATITVAANS